MSTNAENNDVRITGSVKWYDPRKGIGFIKGDDGNDYYIHHSGIKKGHVRHVLLDGENVTFDLKEGEKGAEAANVCILPKETTDKKSDKSDG